MALSNEADLRMFKLAQMIFTVKFEPVKLDDELEPLDEMLVVLLDKLALHFPFLIAVKTV